MKLKVKEIFYSLQGEGVYTGVPTVFVRLAGCNLVPSCSFCDTFEAHSPSSGRDMEVEEILKEVKAHIPHTNSWVCITGGEPLWQEDGLEALVRWLKTSGYLVTVETNGSFVPPRWYTLVDSWNADIKCPSSGVCGVSKDLWLKLRGQDQVKFVVSNVEDLDFAREKMRVRKSFGPVVLVSPVTGLFIDKQEDLVEEYWHNEWLQEVAEFCKATRTRYSIQLHKLIWRGEKGV